MEKMARIVPYITIALRRPAISARSCIPLDDQKIITSKIRITNAGNSGSDDQIHKCYLYLK